MVIEGEKVTDIPADKHTRGGQHVNEANWNAGILKIRCLINEYCPFEATPYMDLGLVFNSQTIMSAPDYIRNHLSAVSGENGIFLKEKHFYHSQYLYVDCEALCADKTQISAPSSSQSSTAPIVKEFTWKTTKHVFLASGDTILKPSEYTTRSSEAKTDKARWECKRINVPVESTDQDGDDSEAADGNVIMPCQVAANPTT
ncbi:MAG: hypothetical protein GF329_11330, partial [Candidatus Lokiarchaeota archaeon]|nr:hypothetical protein [Candidatus Lokiarchaeota archaeon]